MARRAAWAIVVLHAASFAATPLTAQTVTQWRRYELELKTPVRYEGGNPYRDLQLVVYASSSPPTSDLPAPSGFGFWDGTRVEAGQTFNIFKVRTALPRGTHYLWYKCSGATANLNCASDAVLNRAAAARLTLTVGPNPTNLQNNKLYAKGFLQAPAGARSLTYAGDPTTRFYWQGDTAWPAPSREGQAMMAARAANPSLAQAVSDPWKAYVDSRKALGYTVLQVAPAVAWQPRNPSEPIKAGCRNTSAKSMEFDAIVVPFPGPETFAFDQGAPPPGESCKGAIPNNCSRWRPAYWREVDAMVEYANQQGLAIVMTGVADPSDRGHCRVSQDYPRTEDSVTFARNLAARLAGNHVIYSINFDDWPDAVLDSGGLWPGTVDTTTRAVGPELKRVAPRHLVTNHVAGSAPVSAYTDYHGASWLSFHLYQSGHALNLSLSCPGSSGTSWQAKQKCAISRALDITKALRALPPAKPVINGEGAYEYPNRESADPPDNRYGMRHSAYASLLSGAGGFTAGVHGDDPPKSPTDEASIVAWDRPLNVLNSAGAQKDIPKIAELWRVLYPAGTTSWGEFTRAEGVLSDTPPSTAGTPGERRVIAGTQGGNYVAYVPNSDRVSPTASLRGFDCRTWRVEWRDPRGVAASDRRCPASQALTTFARPRCQDTNATDRTGACDWVMWLQRPTGFSAQSSASSYISPSLVEATVDGEPVFTGGGDRVVSQLKSGTDELVGSEVTLSPSEEAFYGIPAAFKEPLSGFSWVVWEAEGSASGDSTDIFARRVGSDGSPHGEAFLVNQQTKYRQYDPFTVVDATGIVTLVWASITEQEDPDSPQTGIFARRFRADGTPLGDEFLVNTSEAKRQEAPVAGADAAGNVVIGWVSGGKEVKLRLFSSGGVPRSGEIPVNPTLPGGLATVEVEWSDLVEIVVDPLGGFVVRWNEYSTADELTGWYARAFDVNGKPLSDAYLEEP